MTVNYHRHGRRTGLGLGVDAGGTYTDAVIFDWDANRVLAKAKAPTSHQDYAIGIGAALDNLPADRLAQVRQVAVSTTLATNAIVEGRGQKVGLLLMPPEGDQDADRVRHQPVRVIGGRISIDGTQLQPVDPDEIARVARELAHGTEGVRAFAVTGYASHVNPVHELAAQAVIRQATGLPVTCGHEVSAIRNYRVRAETAALNARIIPCLQAFLERLRASLDEHGIHAPAMIVRSDGSLMNVATAIERPVETLLSGPAASVAGARFLCDRSDALVVDIGGTTSDTAVLHHGHARTDPDGATVGHWRTHVQALAIHTLGLGGDSEVSLDRHGWHTGPRRVTPVCRLGQAADAAMVAACLDWLEQHPPAEPHLWPIYARLPGASAEGLPARQQQILELLRAGPRPTGYLVHATGCLRPGFLGMDALIDRHLVCAYGFTPTDALHLLGVMTLWDASLARRYAKLLAAADASDPDALARQVVERVERQLARALLLARLADLTGSRAMDGEPGPVAKALLDRGLGATRDALDVRFALGIPVIGIGAPAAFFLPAAAARLQTEAILPPDGDVANAIGAITSGIHVERQIAITPDELGRFHVSGLTDAPTFAELDEAHAFAEQALRARVRELALQAGATEPQLTVQTEDQGAIAANGQPVFIGRTVRVRADGVPA
jgi:N-methylhydantoinase A/oxoprolinase/acetone carboxylase beta subunit